MRNLRVAILLALIASLVSIGCGDPSPQAPVGSWNPGGLDDEPADTWPELGPAEVYNDSHDGLRLIMSYDAARSTFFGTLQNLTSQTLQNVRVKVRLSTEVTLGPTPPVSLPAGANQGVELSAAGHAFEWWGPRVEFSTGSP